MTGQGSIPYSLFPVFSILCLQSLWDEYFDPGVTP